MRHALRRLLSPLALAAFLPLGGCQFALMDPKGQIGVHEKSLILLSTGLMLIVVVPVIVLTLVFAYWYRSSNGKATYMPNWAHSNRIEAVVWTVPCLIILAMAGIAWKTTHELDPYKPIASTAKPIRIDAIALDWKWLFVYPDQHIAVVNQVAFPVGVPVDFHVTSDSVMNSLFIPRLGGQIYAMAGMETELHLIANEAGSYDGMSANFSGSGFSGMKFKALATSSADFDAWVQKIRQTGGPLDGSSYATLEKPSENNAVAYFAPAESGLFEQLIEKYRGKSSDTADAQCGSAAKPGGEL
jgi:cytochrome o ubiquinol oxidase subunit II